MDALAEPPRKRARLEDEGQQEDESQDDSICGALGGIVAQPWNWFNDFKTPGELRVTVYKDVAKNELEFLFQGEWARDIVPHLVHNQLFSVFEKDCTPTQLPDHDDGRWRRRYTFTNGCTTLKPIIMHFSASGEQTSRKPRAPQMQQPARSAMSPQPINEPPKPVSKPKPSRAYGSPAPMQARMPAAREHEPVERPQGDGDIYPEVIIRRDGNRDSKPWVLPISQVDDAITKYRADGWKERETFIDVIGRVHKITFKDKSGLNQDSSFHCSIESLVDEGLVNVNYFVKNVSDWPNVKAGDALAFLNLRRDRKQEPLLGPSHQWPYACWLALGPRQERFSSKDLKQVRLSKSDEDRIFQRLKELRAATLNPPWLQNRDATADDRQVGYSPGGVDNAPAPGGSADRGLVRSKPLPGQPYAPCIVLIKDLLPRMRCDILVEIVNRGWAGPTRSGKKLEFYVRDWTLNERVRKKDDNWVTSAPPDLKLSLLGDRLVDDIEQCGLLKRVEAGGESIVVHFTRVYSSQKNDREMDALMRAEDYYTPDAPQPFRLLSESDEARVPEYREFLARRDRYYNDDGDRPDPPETQRGFDKMTVIAAASAGLPRFSLRRAVELEAGHRCRVDVRCNGFKPDLAALTQFRKLSCRDCRACVPKRALVSKCEGCGADRDWMKLEEPCCQDCWPAIPRDRFGSCDRCDQPIQLSYAFKLRAVEAGQNAINITNKPVNLLVFGEEGNQFLGVEAADITRDTLLERLKMLTDGDRVISLVVQSVKTDTKSGLKVVASAMN